MRLDSVIGFPPDLADHETFDQVSPNGKEKGARPGIPTCRGCIHLDSSSLRILFLYHVNMHLHPKRFTLGPRPNSLKPVIRCTINDRSVTSEQHQKIIEPSLINRLNAPPNKKSMKRRDIH